MTGPKAHLEINDKVLIDWFKKNWSKLEYIGKSKDYRGQVTQLKKETQYLIRDLSPGSKLHSKKNADILIDLWKNLIGDAIIYLKLNDSREVYHDGEIFGTNDLGDILRDFRNYEKLLYGAKNYYRDHLVHTFRVYLLGNYLVMTRLGSFDGINAYDKDLQKVEKIDKGRLAELGMTKKQYLNECRISNGEKQAIWCIAALTHDIGYALEDIDSINEKIRTMVKAFGKASIQELTYLFPPQRRAIDDFVLNFISSSLSIDDEKTGFWIHSQPKYLLKFCRAYEKYDHGIISCTVLMRALVFFMESDYLLDRTKPMEPLDAKQFLIRQNILRSIASHNCEDIYHLSGQNFPFLLLICDELQEWGRPRMDEVFKEEFVEHLVKITRFDPSDRGGLNIEYEVSFEPEDRKTRKAEKPSNEVRFYFIQKTKKFIKILRSGVGGHLRTINLSFTVVDNTMVETQEPRRYIFRLETPSEGRDKLMPNIVDGDNPKRLQDIEMDYEEAKRQKTNP